MNLQEANLQDLLAVYYKGTRAEEAAAHLRADIELHRQLELANLLRDYRERAITSPDEIRLRAAVDELLICYDVLEITALAGFVAPPDGSEFWKQTHIVLTNEHVQRYYAMLYPLKLPRLLRYRIQRLHTRVEGGTPALASFVMQFLALDRRFMATLNDGCLLRMLDSFRIGGYWFSDVVGLIGKPKEFIRRILLPPEGREVPDVALHEFSLFLEFSFDLHRLLGRLADYPLLQSEAWNHYSYWFGIIGEQLKKQLGDALRQFLAWKPDDENQTGAKEIQDYVAEAQHVLDVLTSPAYAVPVDDLLEDVSRL